MRIPKLFNLLFAVALVVGLLPLTAAAQPAAAIDPELRAKLRAEGTANFFVKMAVDADTSAGKGMDTQAARQYVWQTLNRVANDTQGPVLDYCAKNGLDCTPMVINNSVFVRGGNREAVRGLAALPGVAYLRLERILAIPDPLVGGAGIQGFQDRSVAPEATTDWGITDTKADQFWAAFGVKGMGVKVANIDTGVQWNHPALVGQFACPGDPSNAACWADPSNICGGSACDNNGHGTHTMGTMVALDDPNLPYIAGMAPQSTWIACKGCETNSCSDYALTTCATWLLAPGGNPNNAPDVVNNSWGGSGGDPWYQSYVQNWVNAHIFPAFSAGNSGSSCGTLGSPGDYQESFGSAAHASNRVIAYFSSRGPSAFGHDPYTKPNISAPGVSICSSVPTNGWNCGYSGTSMASPHTAGAVALLWSCNPDLAGNIDLTFQVLQNHADAPPAGNCGAPPDGEGNYTYGYGYLNVLAAGTEVCGGVETGTLQGHVYNQYGQPVEGATVSAQPAGESGAVQATTDPNGFYTMSLVVGTYNVTASKANYTSQTAYGVVILANQTTVQDFTITFLGAWTQLPLGTGCPDWTRFDGEYYPGTGYVYLMGGRTGTPTDGTIYRLDPVTNTCTSTGLTMPVPISNYTILTVNNGSADLLCTFGGRDSAGGYTTAVQCLNPVANTVSTVSTLPGELGQFIPGGAAVVNNIAYVFGGFRNTASPYETVQTWAWDPVANTWTQKGNLPVGMGYMQPAAVDGKIYSFGGTIFDGASLYAQVYAYVFDPATGTWNDAAVADLPTAGAEGRAYGFDTGSAYELAGKIVIAGGGQWPAETGEAFTYDIASNSYDYGFPDLNIMRRDHAGFFIPGVAESSPGYMYVLGGRSSASGYGGDNPPFAPPEYYPVNLAGPGEPNIVVTPQSMSSTLCPDSQETQILHICNTGTELLNWSITEVPAKGMLKGSMPFVPVPAAAASETTDTPAIQASSPSAKLVAPQAPSNPAAVLWDQPLSSVNQNSYVDQEFTDYPAYSSFLADDFVNAETWYISTIFVPGGGWNGFTTLLNATALTWQIYADDGGKPAGDPSSGGAAWTLTLAPTDPQVTITNGSYGMPSDTALNLASPVEVPAGHWWLVFYPTMAFGVGGQYGRQPADTLNGYWGQFINPGGGFGYGTAWQSWSVIGATNQDIAFRLEGEAGPPPPPDIPWLSEDPIGGELPGGACADVAVTFDSTGLAIGQYFGSLDVDSNDPDTPTVNVPVDLTVEECIVEPDIEVTPESLYAEQCPDTVTTQTLTACNLGGADLTWSLAEAEPKGVKAVLWDNGPLVTHPGGGYNGGDASAVQTALGMSVYGFGHQYDLNYWVADDFTVADPAGWDLDSMTFYAYQTNSGNTPTINGVYYMILNGPPDAGGTVLCGDTVTNRLANTVFSNIYRVLDTGLTNNQRPIMADTVSIAPGCEHLAAGAYWIMWATDGTLASGPWAPPVTILGQTTTGNAKQSLDGGLSWTDLVDVGPQGLPFIIEGSTGAPPFDAPWLSEDPTSGTVPAGQCQDITVTFDSTGLAVGDYFANIVISSNDPDEPTVTVPVHLKVLDCAAEPLHINRNRIYQHPSAPGVVKVVTQWQVYDQYGAPVEGAVMAGEWTLPDGSVVPAVPVWGLTDYLGRDKFQLKDGGPGLYQFCVTGITKAGYWWNPADPLACLDINILP